MPPISDVMYPSLHKLPKILCTYTIYASKAFMSVNMHPFLNTSEKQPRASKLNYHLNYYLTIKSTVVTEH